VTANGIVTVDGKSHEVDTIIYSTGFETTTYLSALDVTGRGGKPLKGAWSDGAQAYLGITTSGFPNLFMLYGPNTNQGSIIFMLERQVEYIMRQVKRMEAEKIAWMDVRPEVMTSFNDELQKDISKVDVWQAQCGNDFYYRSSSGRLVTQWPHSMDAFVERTTQADSKAFEVGLRCDKNESENLEN
jgi:cation diffusion facilitator CzcD-associated flavoprotein CzcO